MKAMKLTILGVLLSSSVLAGGSVLAAEVGTRDTGAQIIFEENTEIVSPVDPLDPGTPVGPVDPIDPEKPVEPGTNGPLSLDYASSLNFGKQKISSVDQTYFAQPQTVKYEDGSEKEVPLYAQVTDNRGTLKGWSLSVKQNSQFKAGEKELTGSKIEFLNGQIDTVSESPVPSVVKTNFDLTADGNGAVSNVMAAATDEGAGTFVYRFGDDTTKTESVKLTVPGRTTKLKDVAYKTTLTWMLNDVPDTK